LVPKTEQTMKRKRNLRKSVRPRDQCRGSWATRQTEGRKVRPFIIRMDGKKGEEVCGSQRRFNYNRREGAVETPSKSGGRGCSKLLGQRGSGEVPTSRNARGGKGRFGAKPRGGELKKGRGGLHSLKEDRKQNKKRRVKKRQHPFKRPSHRLVKSKEKPTVKKKPERLCSVTEKLRGFDGKGAANTCVVRDGRRRNQMRAGAGLDKVHASHAKGGKDPQGLERGG